MGARGIRRRKKWRKLPEVNDMPPGDVRRLFGSFRWGAYTPAGDLERNGFLLRQWRRSGTRGAWEFVAQAKWVFVLFFGAVGAIALFVRFVV